MIIIIKLGQSKRQSYSTFDLLRYFREGAKFCLPTPSRGYFPSSRNIYNNNYWLALHRVPHYIIYNDAIAEVSVSEGILQFVILRGPLLRCAARIHQQYNIIRCYRTKVNIISFCPHRNATHLQYSSVKCIIIGYINIYNYITKGKYIPPTLPPARFGK